MRNKPLKSASEKQAAIQRKLSSYQSPGHTAKYDHKKHDSRTARRAAGEWGVK